MAVYRRKPTRNQPLEKLQPALKHPSTKESIIFTCGMSQSQHVQERFQKEPTLHQSFLRGPSRWASAKTNGTWEDLISSFQRDFQKHFEICSVRTQDNKFVLVPQNHPLHFEWSPFWFIPKTGTIFPGASNGGGSQYGGPHFELVSEGKPNGEKRVPCGTRLHVGVSCVSALLWQEFQAPPKKSHLRFREPTQGCEGGRYRLLQHLNRELMAKKGRCLINQVFGHAFHQVP